MSNNTPNNNNNKEDLACHQLANPSLSPKQASISNSFAVYNPAKADSVIVGYAPSMTRSDTRAAIDIAHQALPEWRDGTTALHRSQLLQQWSRLILDNQDDIATIMTLESGKPLQESKNEITYSVSFVDYFAAEALRPTGAGGGFLIPTPFTTKNGDDSTTSTATTPPRGTLLAMHQAVGVCALLAPWNFPAAMICRKVAPALAAGCTCVIKPSQLTPLTTMALLELAKQAGIPEQVIQLVICHGEDTKQVGEELATNESVRKISFTGSTTVGKVLLKQCADTIKRSSMELGGNAPFLVLEDANVDVAVAAAVASRFRNAGQTCVCADRFFVHSSLHDVFVDKLLQRIQDTVIVGNGMDEGITMGPLITPDAVDSVHEKVEAAIADGATLVLGGRRDALAHMGPNFYEPTVLTNVSPSSKIICDETFGPVIAIIKVDSDEQALDMANDSTVGLAGYFCTQSLNKAFAFAKALECGLVGVNEGIISTALAPFGGVKESGIGREGSPMGIAEYLETKYIFMNT
jgi:succinate-semialdehyde dehydrogenase/glutarate-semialdehyde dehydrogenase